MISGMGAGLERGVLNLQQGIIQSGLMQERLKWEDERLARTFAHEEAMTEKKLASDRAMLETREAGEDRRLGMREGGEDRRLDVREKGETGRLEMREGGEDRRLEKRESGEERRLGIHEGGLDRRQGVEIGAKKEEGAEARKVDREKLRIEEEHYKREDALRDKYYSALLRAKEGKATEKDDKVMQNYGTHILQPQIQGLNQQKADIIKDTLLDPDLKKEMVDAIDAQIAALDADYRELARLPKRAPAAKGGSGIVSPYKVPVMPSAKP